MYCIVYLTMSACHWQVLHSILGALRQSWPGTDVFHHNNLSILAIFAGTIANDKNKGDKSDENLALFHLVLWLDNRSEVFGLDLLSF